MSSPLLISVNQVYAMHAYYSAGHSIRATAKEFGVSKSGLYSNFKRYGLHVRTVAHAKLLYSNGADTARLLNADWQAGMSIPQVAAKHHYSVSGVNHLLIYYGYKRTSKEVRHYEIAS